MKNTNLKNIEESLIDHAVEKLRDNDNKKTIKNLEKYLFNKIKDNNTKTDWQIEYVCVEIIKKAKYIIWAKKKIKNNQEISQEEANKFIKDAFDESIVAFLFVGILGIIMVPSITKKLKMGLDNNASDMKTAERVEKMIFIHIILFFIGMLFYLLFILFYF